MVEAKLWQKVTAACRKADIPMDDDAPDFICAASGPPPVGVFRLAQEPNEGEADESEVFDSGEEQEEDEDEEELPKKCLTEKPCPTCGAKPRTGRCPLKCDENH